MPLRMNCNTMLNFTTGFASLNPVEKERLKDQFQNAIVDANSYKIITGFKGGKLAVPNARKMVNGYSFLLQKEKRVLFQLIPQVFNNNYHIQNPYKNLLLIVITFNF